MGVVRALPELDFVVELLPALAKRERQAFDMIGLGMSNLEIATAMGIKLSTVRTYTKYIHDKLYIIGRARLAITAYRVGVHK